MDVRIEEHIRAMQLAFVGKLMAGVSHEFKNHLAIIRELSGLLGDLLSFDNNGERTGNDRYKKIISGIDERIVQAAEMCSFLSLFSHRMDQKHSSFSVNDVLEEKIYLLQRFARQKQIALDSSFAADLPAIFNDPALLQFTCFCIIQPALEHFEQDGRILITTCRQDSAVKILVSTKGTRKNSAKNKGTLIPKLLTDLAEKLKAELTIQPCINDHEEVVLLLSSIDTDLSQA